LRADVAFVGRVAQAQLNKVLNDKDLALIDREPKCWYCKQPAKPYTVHDCGFSLNHIHQVIPLAEALKEVKE